MWLPSLHEIALYDTVELAADTETAHAGARGGVVELLDGDKAMVEVTTMPSEPLLRPHRCCAAREAAPRRLIGCPGFTTPGTPASGYVLDTFLNWPGRAPCQLNACAGRM